MPTTSPNMGLTVPVASTGATGTGDPGPGYASNISTDLSSLIDAHDHSSGKGVQVTPAGLNINADLNINSNNLTSVRAARFTSQASGLVLGGDVSELYVKSGDLWYVNSAGTQLQITAGAGLATGTVGATGVQGPAGVTGVFQGSVGQPTAIWQPTGAYSGTYDVLSYLVTSQNSSGTITGVPVSYSIKKAYVASVLANIVGYDGQVGAFDVDLKGTFIGASGNTVTGVGTFTTCYNQKTLAATGWQAVLVPTGTQVSVMISVNTGIGTTSGFSASGFANFSTMMQVTERGYP